MYNKVWRRGVEEEYQMPRWFSLLLNVGSMLHEVQKTELH